MESTLCREAEGGVGVGNTVAIGNLGGVFYVGLGGSAKNERENEVDPRDCPRMWRPMVILTRVEIGFPSTMDVDTEKVLRATSMESATVLPYFHAMPGMEEVPLLDEVMMWVLSKLWYQPMGLPRG